MSEHRPENSDLEDIEEHGREATRRIPDWVWSAKGLNAGERLTLARLWRHAKWNHRTGSFDRQSARVFPSAARLARDMDEPVSTIEKRLTKLRTAGWIRRCKVSSDCGDRRGWELVWMDPVSADRPSTARSTSRKIALTPPSTAESWPPSTADIASVDDGEIPPSTAGSVHPSTAESPSVDGGDSIRRRRTEQIITGSERDQTGLDQEQHASHPPTEPLTPAEERKERIRQNDLERERARAEHRRIFPTGDPRPGACTPEIWAVVTRHRASSLYASDAYGAWAKRLAESVDERGVTPEELDKVLEHWDSERVLLGSGLDAALDDGTFPAMRDIWFFKHREWVRWAIRVVRTPAGMATPSRPVGKRLATARPGSEDTWDRRKRELAMEPDVEPDDSDIEWGPHAEGGSF